MTLKSGSQGDISGVWVTGYGEFVTVEGSSANANFAAGELTVSGCEFNSADISDLSMGAIVPEGADSATTLLHLQQRMPLRLLVMQEQQLLSSMAGLGGLNRFG